MRWAMIAPTPAMSRQDWTILLALSLIWGGSFFFIEVALGSFGPLSLVLVRVAMASAFLWIFLAAREWRRERVPPLDGEGLGWGELLRPTERMEAFTPHL
jgi:drug/metabolite transporter (DMT)-like permease